jgi:hypothetical protein
LSRLPDERGIGWFFDAGPDRIPMATVKALGHPEDTPASARYRRYAAFSESTAGAFSRHDVAYQHTMRQIKRELSSTDVATDPATPVIHGRWFDEDLRISVSLGAAWRIGDGVDFSHCHASGLSDALLRFAWRA